MELPLRKCAGHVALAAGLRSMLGIAVGMVETLIRNALNDDMQAFDPREAEEARGLS